MEIHKRRLWKWKSIHFVFLINGTTEFLCAQNTSRKISWELKWYWKHGPVHSARIRSVKNNHHALHPQRWSQCTPSSEVVSVHSILRGGLGSGLLWSWGEASFQTWLSELNSVSGASATVPHHPAISNLNPALLISYSMSWKVSTPWKLHSKVCPA